jgi:hypothetical protein
MPRMELPPPANINLIRREVRRKKMTQLTKLILVSIALSLLSLATSGVNTATIIVGSNEVGCSAFLVVTNSNDSGAGSLRDAVGSACPASTITFDMTHSQPGVRADGVLRLPATRI